MLASPRLRASLAAILFLGAIALGAAPGLGLLFVFALLPMAVLLGLLGVASLILAVVWVRRGAWRPAVIEGACALAVAAIFFLPSVALAPVRAASAYAQLAITYQVFAAELSAPNPSHDARFLFHETDGFLSWASGLAYDESDEIALKPGEQSDVWREKVVNTPLAFTCWNATHLIGHFYEWHGDYACDSPATR